MITQLTPITKNNSKLMHLRKSEKTTFHEPCVFVKKNMHTGFLVPVIGKRDAFSISKHSFMARESKE